MDNSVVIAPPTLVLVHGFLSGKAYWHKQQQAFSSDFQVITPELAGFGTRHNETCHKNIEHMANDVFEQLDTLGITNFHLLGHSMGGMVVQAMVKQRPAAIDHLILYGTGADGKLPGRFESLQHSIKTHTEATFTENKGNAARSWFGQRHQNTSQQQTDITDALAATDPVSFSNYINGLKAMDTWNGIDDLSGIQQKTLVLWGDQDKSYCWSQPDTLWQLISDSSLAVIPDVGHNIHLDEAHLFNQLVRRFLS